MPYPYTDIIRRSYRGDIAHRHMIAISGHHRIQASPGYRAAAEYVVSQATAAGLQVAIHRYPADTETRFWTSPGFLEWACESASLVLLDAAGQPEQVLCDFAGLPTSLIQRSMPVSGEFEVVAPAGKGGVDPADYAGLDVRGKVVLTNRPVAQVVAVALRQLGAAGILFDGMEAGGRTELDVPDARQYTSFWWPGRVEPDAWGFVISPRQGRSLRGRLAKGQTVRVRAAVDSRFYAGTFEVVDAFLAGSDPAAGEVLLVSHLCHPQPGAHDNASGAAALIETAATLARLVEAGALPRPRRGIRCLWPPEMTGTFAYLAAHEAEMRGARWVAGLNLDMVGADQELTGSSWELVGLPQAAASFSDHLLSWLREPLLDGVRHRETDFSGGSDHYILSDPSVGIPTPMLIQWPDKFYHTSADTPDKVSPDSLARSGTLAAAYACWLANAGPAEVRWLAHLMVSRYATRTATGAAEAVASGVGVQARARFERLHAFRAQRMAAALRELVRLDAGYAAHLPAARGEVAEIAARELAWVREQMGTTTMLRWRRGSSHLRMRTPRLRVKRSCFIPGARAPARSTWAWRCRPTIPSCCRASGRWASAAGMRSTMPRRFCSTGPTAAGASRRSPASSRWRRASSRATSRLPISVSWPTQGCWRWTARGRHTPGPPHEPG
jgi:aminopeptidase YwaD